MAFIKFPVDAFLCTLSYSDKSVFLHLLLHHFKRCGGDYNKEFSITDRDLSNVTGCCLDSITKAKKHLTRAGLINYRIGDKNRTFYTVNSHNGKPRK